MVYSALRCAGLNAAIYTSPHLVDVRERMLVNDSPIPRAAFARWTEELQGTVEECEASFFEATTAMALADFAARGTDIAVVEVGLGGRLDATNVVSPLVSAVTNVSLDHTEYLGNTLEEIAREKAGIAKAGTPFIIGETDSELVECLRLSALEKGAEVHVLPAGHSYSGPMMLEGSYQRRNAALAEAVASYLPDTCRPSKAEVEKGIGSAFLPGRFDRRGKWLFDVAHNPSGVEALVDQMRTAKLPRPIHALVGMVGDKDWRSVLATLRTEVDALWLSTAPSMPRDRVTDIDQMATQAGLDLVAEPSFDTALADMQRDANTALVTGSFFTVGDALARLPGFAPLG